jgi:hypothetical protein
MARKETNKSDKPRLNAKLCAEFRGNVEKFRKGFRDNIEQYHDCHNFVFGSQWEDDEEQLLKNYNKIPLQSNKIAPLANTLIGEQRMNTPQLEAVPDEDIIDQNTIAVRQALVKEISLNSKSKIVYQTAHQQAMIGGYGAYYVDSNYINNKSFDQTPMMQSVKDATKCFWDLGADSICKTDGMYSGFYIKMSRELFRKKYGRSVECSIPPTVTETEDDSYASFEWNNDETITIGVVWKRKLVSGTLYELEDNEGKTYCVDDKEFSDLENMRMVKGSHDPYEIDDEHSDEEDYDEYLMYQGRPCVISRKRKIVSYKIKKYKWAGDYILDETDFHSQQLPLVFVDQNSYWDKEGRQVCRPLFKDARDSQRFVNYLFTQIAYLIKVSRYDQFMGSRENVKSPKTQLIWKNPSVQQGMLVYDVDKAGGTKPEQLRPPEIPVSLLQHYERACNDIQSSVGMYNAELGREGNERSGSHAEARIRQGMYKNFIVRDAINRAIEVGGEIVNEMIPHLFDTERKMTLEVGDSGRKAVVLNQQADEYGVTISNDMTVGDFKIRLLPGASYEGQKAEGLEALQMILQAAPDLFTLIADLYAKNLPIADVVELTNRLRTIVPPEIIEAGKTGQPVQQKPQAPPPDFVLKMKELALKEKELQAKVMKMQQEMKIDDMDMQLRVQEMQVKREEAASNLQEHIMGYMAETHRTETDAQIANAQNIVELLTRPNHLNQPPRPTPK